MPIRQDPAKGSTGINQEISEGEGISRLYYLWMWPVLLFVHQGTGGQGCCK